MWSEKRRRQNTPYYTHSSNFDLSIFIVSVDQQHGNVLEAPEPEGVVHPAFETDVAGSVDGISGLVLQTTQLMIKWQLKLQHMRRNARPH